MFTIYQDAEMGRKDRRDPQDRFASGMDLPWTRRSRQRVFTPGRFPVREATVLWLRDPGLPAPTDVHGVVVVEDLLSALRTALWQGYTLAVEPAVVTVGTCAIIQGGTGLRLCLLEPKQAP